MASESGNTNEIASIEAQLALSRASLADKIFARYGQSTSGGSGSGGGSNSKKNNASSPSRDANGVEGNKQKAAASSAQPSAFQHRPPTLGLGAQPAQQSASQAGSVNGNLSIADARLKGRLAGGKKGRDDGVGQNGKRKAEDDDDADDDDGESRAAVANKGDKKKKAAKADPFAPKPAKAGKQQQQAAVTPAKAESPAAIAASASPEPASPAKLSKSQRKKLNKKRRLEGGGGEAVNDTSAADDTSKPAQHASPPPPVATTAYQPSATLPEMGAQTTPSNAALSEHQKQLRAKLQGSQFRQLNESLYTSESADSFRLAQEDPTRMQAYHEGFREQTKKWPEKPFEMIGNVIVDAIEASWARLVAGPTTKKSNKAVALGDDAAIPPGAVIADLGAGEGPLTKYLSTHSKLVGPKSTVPEPLRPHVLAFDLLDTADGIVRGVDCARAGGVPLPGKAGNGGVNQRIQEHVARSKSASSTASSSADVAVFCLSLMGTDWVNMVIEARRVLRNGGSLIIAEVTSRLSSPDAFVDLIEQLGFKLDDDTRTAENTHFILFRFHKWTNVEVAARAKKMAAEEAPADEHEARRLDELEEEQLVKTGQDVLKPCLYKRR